MVQHIKNIFNYRDMISSLVKRELRGRYQKSVLGMLWNFLNPLCQVAIYTFVFSVVFPSSMENYYIYLTVGIIPWTFFSEGLVQGSGSIVYNSDLTKKIYFPRETLTIASTIAKFVNLLLSFAIIFLFLFISGMGIKFSLLIWLVPILFSEFCITLGFSLMTSSITVYLRDMEYIVSVLMMAWVWATPIMYTLDGRSELIVKILKINPLTNIIIAYHDVLYYQKAPVVNEIISMIIISIIVLAIGELIFAHLEADFAEEL